jgi:hypothetical protein
MVLFMSVSSASIFINCTTFRTKGNRGNLNIHSLSDYRKVNLLCQSIQNSKRQEKLPRNIMTTTYGDQLKSQSDLESMEQRWRLTGTSALVMASALTYALYHCSSGLTHQDIQLLRRNLIQLGKKTAYSAWLAKLSARLKP